MNCSSCGALNHKDAKFCKICGEPLDEANKIACPVCGIPMRPGARFCRNCGQPLVQLSVLTTHPCPHCGVSLRLDASFCKVCGQPLANTTSQRRCSSCGEVLRHAVHFCHICGAPVDTRATKIPQVRPKPPNQYVPSGKAAGEAMRSIAGRYLIMEKIAEGGMGAIYQAQDQRLNNKIVAIKEIAGHVIPKEEREEVLQAFTREAELLARLSHPNLVRVTDLIHKGEYRYMVMEFVVGQTLEQKMQSMQSSFSESQVLVWAKQLCEVLYYLHSQSPPIIYRDIKPSNIMVLDGSDQIKLIDFGIARFFKPGKSKDTIQFGTDGYAPPEQYGQAQTDIRADIYALGATLHQLLTLRDPQKVLFEFPSVRKLNPAISARVEFAIQKAVEPNRNSRYTSMETFWEALSGDSFGTATLPVSEDSAFLAYKEPELPLPDEVSVQPVLALGRVARGPLTIVRELHIPPGNEASVMPDVPWIEVYPHTLDSEGGQVEVRVYVQNLKVEHLVLDGNTFLRWIGWHTSHFVPLARQHQGAVLILYADEDAEQYPISLEVQPTIWQTILGWMLTVGLILLEVGIPIGLLLLLTVILLG